MYVQTEEKLRRKARKAATKENKPLFGEDGVRRGMLEKYDEEEEEDGMEIDASGAIEEARRKKQAEIRAKLKQGLTSIAIFIISSHLFIPQLQLAHYFLISESACCILPCLRTAITPTQRGNSTWYIISHIDIVLSSLCK